MEKIVIEIIRPGKISNEYFSFTSWPVYVGRGFNNDVIVDDSFVSPRHCEITLTENGMRIQDCDSKNGTSIASSAEKQTAFDLASGGEIVVGRTHLKIYLGSHPVDEALPMTSQTKLASLIEHPLCAWVLLFILSLFGWFSGYITTIENDKKGVAFFGAMMTVSVIVLWAGFWSIINRIIRHKFSYGVHFSIGCLWCISYGIFNFIFDYTAFYFNSEGLYGFLLISMYAAISYLGFRTHFDFSTRMTNRKKTFFSVAIILVILSLSGISRKFADENQYFKMNDFSSINPPYLGNPKAYSIEEVIKRSGRVFED